MSPRNVLKFAAPAIARYSGLGRAIAFRYGGLGTIFLLHSVIPDDAFCPEEFTRCPISVLEAALSWLKDNGIRFVSLDTALQMLANPATKDRFCVFTFDDGYADNLTHVLPIMEHFNAPFTVYVATGMLTGEIDTSWWFGLAALIRSVDRFELPEIGSRFECADPGSKKRVFTAVATLAETDCRALAAVKTALATNGIDGRVVVRTESLTTEQLLQLAASPLVTIGAHTVRHVRLALAPTTEVEREMADSRRLLESILQREIRHFAYPFGACGPREARVAQSVGFRTAVTTQHGSLFSKHLDHPYELPREAILAWETPSSLRCKIDGAYRAFHSGLGDPVAHLSGGGHRY